MGSQKNKDEKNKKSQNLKQIYKAKRMKEMKINE